MMDMDPRPTNNKAEILRNVVVPKITTAIGRPIEPEEMGALSFVVEKKGPDAFAIEGGLSPKDSAWKVRNVVYQTKIEEIESRMSASSSNPQETGRLKALRTYFEFMQKKAKEAYDSPEEKVSLGAVPNDWLPDWAKQI